MSSADILLPVGIALIGFLGSLLVALTALLGIRMTIRGELSREQQRTASERQRWLLDLKLASYADLIRAADDFRKAATDLRNTQETDQLESGKKFEEQSHLLDRAASRVNLVGSAELQGPLHALVLQGFTSISNILEGKGDPSEASWQQALGVYYTRYDAFLNAAREDLGLGPLPRPVEIPVESSRQDQP